MKPYKNITYGTRLFLTILLVVFFNFILTIIPLPGLAKTSIKTFFTSFYMKQRLSVGGLGIEPILSAYFILSFLYYLFQWFEKKTSLQSYSFQKILLVVSFILISIMYYSPYAPEMTKQLHLSGGPLSFPTTFLIYFSMTASVVAGYLIIQLIDRLGVVDGVLALKLIIPFLFIGPFMILKNIWTSQLAQLPDNNARIAWLLLFIIILAGLILLFRKIWRHGFFFCKIPLKTGRELTIPIYTAGLFFFRLPGMIMMHIPNSLIQHYPPIFMKIFLPEFLYPITIISGYLLYIYLGRLVIDFNVLGDKLADSATPRKIFNLTYKRFGLLQLVLSSTGFFLLMLNQRLRHLPLVSAEISLAMFILNYFLLFLVLFLGWGTHRKIVKGNLYAVFQTKRMNDFLAAQVQLVENGINIVSHQHDYNYISGYAIGPLSEKTIFIDEKDKEQALALLEDMKGPYPLQYPSS